MSESAQASFGGELRAYVWALGKNWVWFVTSSLVAAGAWFYQGAGNVIPAWALWLVGFSGFTVASFLAWREQQRKYGEIKAGYDRLTGKTSVEAIDELIRAFENLDTYYATIQRTDPELLNNLTEKAIQELRYHAPQGVHRFKNAFSNPNALRETPFPRVGDGTVEAMTEWLSDKTRHECWQKASACLHDLKNTKTDALDRLRR